MTGTNESQSPGYSRLVVENTLSKSELFGGLAPTELREIANFTVVKSLDKGRYLFREGDATHGFYIVQKGCINLHRTNHTGKEQVIHIFRVGESLGVATIASDSVCPAHARAEQRTEVLLVKKNEFIALLLRRPSLVFRVLANMCTHCRVMCMQFDDLTLQDVETRLCHWLLHRCPDTNSDLPVPIRLTIPKRVLAAELGTVSETLSRALARYREKDFLTVQGKSITIHSPARLRDFLKRHLEK